MTLPRSLLAFAPVLTAAVLASSLVLVACSSDETGGPAGTNDTDAATPVAEGGATTESGSPESGTDSSTLPDAADAGACSSAVNGASVVGEVAGAGPKPAPAGGVIADGTYYLTQHEVFAPAMPDSNTRRRTIVFAGNTVKTAENDTGRPESRSAGTYVVAGSNITFTITCPITTTVTIPYTATATSFATFSQSDDIFTSTKQ